LEVDVEDSLPKISSLLQQHGYEYVVEQDSLLQGTSLRYVYAIRPSTERKLIRRQSNGAHIEPLPLVNTALLSEREIRAFLTTKLPEYMVPSDFIFVDALPLTPNGKLNRSELLALRQGHKNLEKKFAAPSTPAEELLANLWAQVLKLEKVGIHDNFFELGGHSLLATKIVSRIRSRFSVPFSLREFFEAPTVYALAQRLENRGETRQINQNDQITRVVRDQFRVDQG
jgi:acyl carrier protein